MENIKGIGCNISNKDQKPDIFGTQFYITVMYEVDIYILICTKFTLQNLKDFFQKKHLATYKNYHNYILPDCINELFI